jgi:UPF0176 protein
MSQAAFHKQKQKRLYNLADIGTLKARLEAETEPRVTVSFYRYVRIEDPAAMRDRLYETWEGFGVLGRIYVAAEGINAQCSIPAPRYAEFLAHLESVFPTMPLKVAVEQDAESFYKLIVKCKRKILADGQDDDSYDVTNVGSHLTAAEFNAALARPGTVVVDVRNNFESEIGHFEGALRPDVATFRDELPVIKEMLAGKEENKILLYCTGGIRCEKASAWLKHQGFKDVNQLYGGIINYAHQVREQGLENKFIGRNFVFDARMGESISGDVIASCHQCGSPADMHTNCAWDGCHLLFIQCSSCAETMDGCCSPECQDTLKLPEEDKKKLRQEIAAQAPAFRRSRRDPHEAVRLAVARSGSAT